jgi:hypothetical protein
VRRTTSAVTSAATTILVAAFVLSGCSAEGAKPATPAPSLVPAGQAPVGAPLPDPDALAAILSQLADPTLPGPQKVALLQYGTAEDEAPIQSFGQALVDNGYAPPVVTATDLAWAPQPGDVTATVTMSSSDPAHAPFTYPLQFTPRNDGWQLTRRSAEQLLPGIVAAPSPPPAPPAPVAPEPAPEPAPVPTPPG